MHVIFATHSLYAVHALHPVCEQFSSSFFLQAVRPLLQCHDC